MFSTPPGEIPWSQTNTLPAAQLADRFPSTGPRRSSQPPLLADALSQEIIGRASLRIGESLPHVDLCTQWAAWVRAMGGRAADPQAIIVKDLPCGQDQDGPKAGFFGREVSSPDLLLADWELPFCARGPHALLSPMAPWDTSFQRHRLPG